MIDLLQLNTTKNSGSLMVQFVIGCAVWLKNFSAIFKLLISLRFLFQ